MGWAFNIVLALETSCIQGRGHFRTSWGMVGKFTNINMTSTVHILFGASRIRVFLQLGLSLLILLVQETQHAP